jgi:hypothetical protein
MNTAWTRPALAAGVLTALGAPALAADWEMNPRIEAGVIYDDNYRLTTPGPSEIDVTGPVVDAEMEMRALTQTGEFSFAPRVRATYFPDASELDAVDYFATLNWERRGQRVFTRLRGDFAQQDIVTAQQPDVDAGGDLGEPDFGDSGQTLVDNRQLRGTLRPSLSFDISERRAMQFDAGYTHVSFDDEVVASQVDFNVADVGVGLLTRLTPTNSLTFRARGARYDIETREATNGYGAELQWDKLTEADTRAYFRVGAQNIELADGEKETAWLLGVGTNWILGRNELFLDVARNVGPSSAGTLVTRDQLRLRWTRAITPRLSLLAGLRGTRDEDFDDSALSTFAERSYATGDLGLQWRWQEEFSLRVSYDYTWQEFENAVSDATSSGAMVSVLYQPLQRRR